MHTVSPAYRIYIELQPILNQMQVNGSKHHYYPYHIRIKRKRDTGTLVDTLSRTMGAINSTSSMADLTRWVWPLPYFFPYI